MRNKNDGGEKSDWLQREQARIYGKVADSLALSRSVQELVDFSVKTFTREKTVQNETKRNFVSKYFEIFSLSLICVIVLRKFIYGRSMCSTRFVQSIFVTPDEPNLSRFGTTVLPTVDHKPSLVVEVAGTANEMRASFATVRK